MFSASRVHFAWICVYLSAVIPSETRHLACAGAVAVEALGEEVQSATTTPKGAIP